MCVRVCVRVRVRCCCSDGLVRSILGGWVSRIGRWLMGNALQRPRGGCVDSVQSVIYVSVRVCVFFIPLSCGLGKQAGPGVAAGREMLCNTLL
jgi:hypothetical protein